MGGGHEAEPPTSSGEGDAKSTPEDEAPRPAAAAPPVLGGDGGGGGGGGFDDGCSIFPPSEHEGLFLRPDPYKTLARPSKSSSPLSRGDKEGAGEEDAAVAALDRASSVATRLLDVARRVMGGRFESIHSKTGLRVGGGGGGVWSIAAMVGLMGVLMYMRRRDRQERDILLLLVKEKDQMIGQLLHQIALMNEVSTLRKP